MMIKIAHIITHPREYRVHIPFYDLPGQVENYFVIPELTDNLKKRKYIVVNKPFHKNVSQKIDELKPDFIIYSKYFYKKFYPYWSKMFEKYPFYFINHGIINSLNSDNLKNDKDFKLSLKTFKGFFLNPYERKIFIEYGLDHNKIININGTPQINQICNNNYQKLKKKFYSEMTPQFNKRTKTILFLQNQFNLIVKQREYPDLISIKDYCDTLQEIKRFADQYQYNIIIKFKGDCAGTGLLDEHEYSDLVSELHNSDNIYLIVMNNIKPLANLLFSDIVIIQEGGTSVREALLVNQKVIVAKGSFEQDFSELSKYTSIPQLKPDQIYNQLIQFDSPDYQPSYQLEIEIESYIGDYYGDIMDSNVVDTIYQIFLSS